MTIFQSFLLGIVQGLTEFIPVSSTAHLLIGQKILGIPANDAMFSFLVLVQMGTIVSLIIFFWKDLWKILLATLSSIKHLAAREPGKLDLEARLGWFIIIATIPALIFGYLLKSTVESLFRTPLLEAGIRLIITAVVLALAEWLGKRNRTLEKMTWLDALIVGFGQVLAVFPGASRSGTTIAAGMACGLVRSYAARFAFMMSVPVMLAAGGYETLDLLKMPGLGSFLPMIAVGLVTAAVVGWLAIKWLLDYLSKHSLYVFAGYCAIAGMVVLIIQLFVR
jgi:undecaprenyl-diphosphatase